jgi:four helix bundle protein
MTEIQNKGNGKFDLEDRTYLFARDVRDFMKSIPKNVSNFEYIKQLIRSSGSVGANYIEANESLSKKDFIMRVKICRKEIKESRYWLRLIELDGSSDQENKRSNLIKESTELMKIFGAILEKCK